MSKYTSRAVGPVDTIDMATTRAEAKARGDTYFFSGVPCRRGHVAARYVSSPMCVECCKLGYDRRRPKTLETLKRRYREDPEKFKQQERARAHRNPKRYWAKHSVKNAAARAAKVGVPFDLTTEYLLSIITDTCPVFGTPFIFVGNGKVSMDSASLDRKVPAKGYVQGNVVVISQMANTIKSNATSKEVARVAQWMYENGL